MWASPTIIDGAGRIRVIESDSENKKESKDKHINYAGKWYKKNSTKTLAK